MDDESGSLKILRTKDWLKFNSSRLFILYFSDPRSHWVYRKRQYYQGGMRCCLMRLLLTVLSNMIQSPQLLSHIHIWPKPKVKLSPTDSFYPAPPSSHVIATATNPRQIGLIDRDLSLTKMGLQSLCMDLLPKSVSPSLRNRSYRDCNVNSLFPFHNISVPPKLANRSHRVYLTNSLASLLPKSVSPSLCNRSHRDYVMP